MRNTIIIVVVGLAIITALVALKPKQKSEAANTHTTTQKVVEVQSHAFTPPQKVRTTEQTNLTPAPASHAPPLIKAEDTLEAKQIETLLAQHGFEPAAFRDAYNYAYEHRRLGGLIGSSPDEGARLHLEFLLRDYKARLEKFGPLTEAFLTNLLAIQPTVFIGQPDIGGAIPELPLAWQKQLKEKEAGP